MKHLLPGAVLPLLSLLFFPDALAASASKTVRGQALSITFDGKTHKRLNWKSAGTSSVLAFETEGQDGIEANGWMVRDFVLDSRRSRVGRKKHPQFGSGASATIVGLFDELTRGSHMKIEKHTQVWLPDRHPNVAVFQTRYKNVGIHTVQIGRVDSQRVLLRRPADGTRQRGPAFVSFQGGAYKWGRDYSVLPLTPGFQQSNFQGVGDPRGKEGLGGGMPFVDAWSPQMGVALVHLSTRPEWLSLPVQVRDDGAVDMAVQEKPEAHLGQKTVLAPGEGFETVMTAVLVHHGDFYDPLRNYGELLRDRGVKIPRKSKAHAHDAYWKSWGFRREFTQKTILDMLPQLKATNIRVMNLDDGWYDFMGDWNLNEAPGKFPGGDADMAAFVKKVHDAGFETSLWWYPLGVDPKSVLAKQRRDLLVLDAGGNATSDGSDLHQLCPAHPASLQHIRNVLERAIDVWGYDGVYTDFTGLAAVPPCFNPAHKHQTPLDSFRELPRMYQMIHEVLTAKTEKLRHEVCICGIPHSPYHMPYYNIANTSDPLSLLQVRRRVKVEKAIRGGQFAVGDGYQVPIHEWGGVSVPESLESGIGTGSQLTGFFKTLDAEQQANWKRWFGDYEDMNLSRQGVYRNLYDLGWDKPEAHVVQKGVDLYYAFFAEAWPNKGVELRGLDPKRRYAVYDYENQRELGFIDGHTPVLTKGFRGHLLIRVRPVGRAKPPKKPAKPAKN